MADDEDRGQRFAVVLCRGKKPNGQPCLAKITNREEYCSSCKTQLAGKHVESGARFLTSQGSDIPEYQDSRSQKKYLINFHTIIERSIITRRGFQGIYLKFDYVGHGYSDPTKHMLEYDRDIGEYSMYKCSLSLSEKECSSKYSYYFLFQYEEAKQEYLKNRKGNKRTLDIRFKEVKEATVNHYDGFIKIERVYKRFSTEQTQLKDEAATCLSVFFKLMKDDSGEILVIKIKELTSSLRNVYLEACDNLTDVDEVLRKGVDKEFNWFWDDLKKLDPHDEEGKTHRFLFSLTILLLIKKSQMSDVTQQQKALLCYSLLPGVDTNTKVCYGIDRVISAFPSEDRTLKKALVDFVNGLTHVQGCIEWLLCMPLVHFLQKICRPWEPASQDIVHQSSHWWGLKISETVVLDLTTVKKKCTFSDTEKKLVEIGKKLSLYFEIDYLLPRTLIASVKLSQLSAVTKELRIPPDVIFACLYFHIKTKQTTELKKKESIIRSSIFQSTAKRQSDNWSPDHEPDFRHRAICIGIDMLKEVVGKDNLTVPVVIQTARAVLIQLHYYQSVAKLDDKKEERSLFVEQLNRTNNLIAEWLQKTSSFKPGKSLCDNLTIWNKMFVFEIHIPEGLVKSSFNTRMKRELQNALILWPHDSQLVTAYCKSEEKICEEVSGVLADFLFRALQSEPGRKNTNIDFDELKMDGLKKLGRLLSVILEQKLVKKGDIATKAGVLKLIKDCSFFPYYIKFLYNTKIQCFLRDSCVKHLSHIMDVLKCIVENILRGEIEVQYLLDVKHNETVFQNVFKEVPSMKSDIIKRAVQLRLNDLESFKSCLGKLKQFVNLCHRFTGNLPSVDTMIKNSENYKELHLNQLCKPKGIHQIDNLETLDTAEPCLTDVTAFDLPNETLMEMCSVVKNCKGYIFLQLWEKQGKSIANEVEKITGVDQILQNVAIPAMQDWKALYQKLESGTIQFKEFEKLCGRANEEDIKELLIPFEDGIERPWINDRINQLSRFRSLDSCVNGANVISEIVEIYSMDGDFKTVKRILDLACTENSPMKEVEQLDLRSCAMLQTIDRKKVECLLRFRDSKPLVDWMRVKMKDGLKELKVFCDLAYIATGDDPMEISKVTCLQSAAVGYENLIFNLEQGCSLAEFLEKCEEVWKALQTNPLLPDQLEDTCRQLDWLKVVEEIRGSVEMTSLAQAESINASGTFIIGNLKTGSNQSALALDDVLELRFTTTRGTSEKQQCYKYNQLRDLQSRLMLVAANTERNKYDVNRFLEILDAVKFLGNVYLKIVSSGCVLFSTFQVSFRCNKESKVCIFITFGETEDKQRIRGERDAFSSDDSSIIRTVGKRLEKCYDEWLAYTNELRNENCVLNFFNMPQLVILQKELAKIGRNATPCNLVYPLLFPLKRNCKMADVRQALLLAKKDILDMDKKEDSDSKSHSDNQHTEKSPADNFVEKMKQANFSEFLAKEALKQISPDQIEKGIEWCLENESEFVEPEPVENDDNFGWCQIEDSLEMVTIKILETITPSSGDGLSHVIQNLVDVWQNFLTSASSSFSDFLSLNHLAIILKRLAEEEEISVNGSFQVTGCEEGKPNLFVCSQGEMFNTVLAIYNAYNNECLPSSEDVLLCSEETTLEMLDIFWRRAFLSGGNAVHCLVNADLLRYDISDHGEKEMEGYMEKAQQKGLKYKLVVICSSENEFKCRLVAALDRYRRPNLTIGGNLSVKEYVHRVFTKESKEVKGSASAVDFERSSVRVAKSYRAGVGKSFYARKMVTDLQKRKQSQQNLSNDKYVLSLPIYGKVLLIDEVMDVLLPITLPPEEEACKIMHIDISHEVEKGVDAFLFQLLILGCLHHRSGYVWRRSKRDYYIIESMPIMLNAENKETTEMKYFHSCLGILPDVICRSPLESLKILSGDKPKGFKDTDIIFDTNECNSEKFQRPFQYLIRSLKKQSLSNVKLSKADGDRKTCLETLLRHCGVPDPSWTELCHYVSFLNRQLLDFEKSVFCALPHTDLPGFPEFVLKFILQMSRDFATRSLVCSESENNTSKRFGDDMYEIRRTWETSTHPYLFFNPDGHTMTFLGFTINSSTGDVVDKKSGKILQANIMSRRLFQCLTLQGVNLERDFDQLPRQEKLKELCTAIGIEVGNDPDKTYELTTDNVKKILAVYMRLKCEIPVLIMGETGCGKTRLIKFMCDLQAAEAARKSNTEIENMIIMKVHGGTTTRDIIDKVREAEKLAEKNAKAFPTLFTILFFDEANTTSAVGTIKEVMCDKSLGGQPIKLHRNLKIVAACNPYRKHKKEVIYHLEQAGLGYYVNAEKTEDRFGRVPMRRLVYRVQPLPPSMMPLVWDFGILNDNIEKIYIKQMVLRYIDENEIPALPNLEDVVSSLFSECQKYMRKQEDECSFVSLRDVERSLQVAAWFLTQTDTNRLLEDESSKCLGKKLTRALVLAIGVCYQSALKDKSAFHNVLGTCITQPLVPSVEMYNEVSRCQDTLLKNITLPENIARNQALKENLFLMLVCIELRVPLFLVGKPGSSKSLAKTIIADAMQGTSSRNILLKQYKQVQMVSFQCSPLSTPEGISAIFNQCAEFQKAKDLDKFASVVVLDEVGLAEDSSKMPLKALHYLLENGCPGDERPVKERKVAFIGISNWALDPAKMNRGIFVQRSVPDERELIDTARGICETSDEKTHSAISNLIQPLSNSYLDLFEEAKKCKEREFFGLRDFYSLVKHIYATTSIKKITPSWQELQHIILRNFGGLEEINPLLIFKKHLSQVYEIDEQAFGDNPDCSTASMINACLSRDKRNNARYLLLLTENYGDLDVLRQKIQSIKQADVIFGSSFPCDQEYSQVCRNINKIKVCMENGTTVILLNLENLYESLYDALNQYYVYYGGERFVDLGLGSHRVKCKVHENFRLMVVAEKETVYNTFAIPLINRLEKHILSLTTILTTQQQQLSIHLERWVKAFCSEEGLKRHDTRHQNQRKPSDIFMGYNPDTCAAIILMLSDKSVCESVTEEEYEQVLNRAKETLLWCSTPDAVLRLGSTALAKDMNDLMDVYFKRQEHESLLQYLHTYSKLKQNMRIQITTHSKLLAKADLHQLCKSLGVIERNVQLLTLQTLDTEQQFCKKMRNSFNEPSGNSKFKLLIVQCSSGDTNADLIACARYSIQDAFKRSAKTDTNTHVLLIVQLPRVTCHTFTGFQCGIWQSVHLDDLHPLPDYMPSFSDMYMTSVSALMVSTTDTDIEESVNKHRLDVTSLIFDCIQPALALVKDQATDMSRTAERIKLIFSLKEDKTNKENEGQKNFAGGIAAHLTSLLREKEGLDNQKEWLTREAGSSDHINRAGTFRRSVLQCIQTKLVYFLAGIIAFVDKNRNMDILAKAECWKRKIWLEILNSPSVTCLKYEDLIGQKQNKVPSEFIVEGTSHDGELFNAKMPFSWIIQTLIDKLFKHIFDRPDMKDDSMQTLIENTADALEQTELGKILEGIDDVQMALDCYIDDFIQIVYTVKTESELQVVHNTLLTQCNSNTDGKSNRLSFMFVACQAHFYANENMYRHFEDVTSVWPGCGEKAMEFTKNCKVSEVKMSLDLVGLHVLVENLHPPEKEALNSQEGKIEWMKKLCCYRPVAERIFVYFDENSRQLSDKCSDILQETRCAWTKAKVMKLFIDIVCIDDTLVKYCMSLWMLLGTKADLKSVQTLKVIERFLTIRNNDVCKTLFSNDNCKHCKTKHQKRPTTFPCSHTICAICYTDALLKNGFKCPVCDQTFPIDFTPPPSDESENTYNEFVRNCNTFFMEVVSQLCFAGRKPPSDDVVIKLLSYITVQSKKGWMYSKNMEVIDDAFDRTPVVRSFLLQLLMRTRNKEVEKHLQEYFNNAVKLVQTQERDQNATPEVEVCVLVLQCMEDLQHQCFVGQTKIEEANRIFIEAKDKIKMPLEKRLENLQHLANTRFAVIVVANVVYNVYVKKSIKIRQWHKKLFSGMDELFKSCGTDYPKLFFIKYFCRRFGVDCYQVLRSKCDVTLKPVISAPQLEKEMVECQDRFIVCGKAYRDFREIMANVVVSQSIKPVLDMLQTYKDQQEIELYFLLAVYRECTMKFKSEKQYLSQLTESARRSLLQIKDVKQKDLLENMLQNTVWHSLQNISTTMDLGSQGLSCLLTHFLVLLKNIPENQSLLTPIQNLSFHPSVMTDSYFPTMPHDELDEIKAALMRPGARHENLVLYRCPNGHPYVIGECGKPATTAKCIKCKETIGGQRHKLEAGNKLDDGNDQTKPGHILGSIKDNANISLAPERNLSATSCGILRLVTHIAMYIGTRNNVRAVCKSIQPPVVEDEVPLFLMQHIEHDISTLSTVFGKSREDVLTLMHCFLQTIMEIQSKSIQKGLQVRTGMHVLKNKESRERWEDLFNKEYILLFMKGSENHLASINKEIASDKRFGSDPLLKLLYEQEVQVSDELPLCDNPSIWLYRDIISVEHLMQKVDNHDNKCPILRLFLKKEYCLRALRFVPGVVCLQKMLISTFAGKIERQEAAKYSIEKIKTQLKNDPRCADFDQCFQDFVDAWEIIRHSLDGYRFPMTGNMVQVKAKYCHRPIDESMPLSFLLPANGSSELCGIALLFFLLEQHNQFLEQYLLVSKTATYERFPKVLVKDITSADLITYHLENDLLPLVFANCDYTFKVGKSTEIAYNFGNIEKQLIDRFLFTKSIVLLESMEIMTYKSEITNATVFMSLRTKVKQERISPTVLTQIREELQNKPFPTICESMDKLDIAISFMKSIGANQDESLSDFIVQTLKMDRTFASSKAQQTLQCKHIQSLWITLSLERNKRLHKSGKESFSNVTLTFKEDLNDYQKKRLEKSIKFLQMIQLEMFLEILLECIVLAIDIPRKDEEAYDPAAISLADGLDAFQFDFPYEDPFPKCDWLQTVVNALRTSQGDENTLLCCHCVDTWKVIFDKYMEKAKQR